MVFDTAGSPEDNNNIEAVIIGTLSFYPTLFVAPAFLVRFLALAQDCRTWKVPSCVSLFLCQLW